jgi:large subunit ribosomal protein L24
MIQVQKKKWSLRKNDQVAVIAGKEKGKVGKVLALNAKTGRVTVENVNRVKRHIKQSPTQMGGIVEKELPLDYSNVLLFCSHCNRGVRHGVKVEAGDKQKKVRVCKRCDAKLDPA